MKYMQCGIELRDAEKVFNSSIAIVYVIVARNGGNRPNERNTASSP